MRPCDWLSESGCDQWLARGTGLLVIEEAQNRGEGLDVRHLELGDQSTQLADLSTIQIAAEARNCTQRTTRPTADDSRGRGLIEKA